MYGQLEKIVIQGPIDKERACLLSAHLASLLDGAQPGHLDHEALVELSKNFKIELERVGLMDAAGLATAVAMRAEVVWSAFRRATAATADERHPETGLAFALADTRDPEPDYGGCELLTLSQMQWAGEAVRAGAKALRRSHLAHIRSDEIAALADRREQMAEVVECLREGLKDAAVAGSFLKGSAAWIVWMTPVEGRVAELLRFRDLHGIAQEALDQLRNLLGLWKEDGRSDRPLAAFRLRCPEGLRAPNVITANGYERFRHRPSTEIPAAPNAGLTFNLDRIRAFRDPGSCELVSSNVIFAHVFAVEMAGQPSEMTMHKDEVLASHLEYANAISDGRSWKEILDGLEAQL